ncbi:hypothetical protein MKX01_038273 [Papaver californicum]|nr:hypothetical protein MKX01_038273 [Papaver californicum]
MVDFKRSDFVFLLLTTLFALNQASRDIMELGEVIASGSSKLYIPRCRPRQCEGMGSCWCCIYLEGAKRCTKEKDVCIANCHAPPQRA